MNNQQIEIIFKILSLLSTIEEGLRYVQSQLTESKYSEALLTLEEVIEGIMGIDKAINLIKSEYEESLYKELRKIRENLNRYIAKMIILYEDENYEKLERNMKLLIKVFVKWRECVKAIIKFKVVL